MFNNVYANCSYGINMTTVHRDYGNKIVSYTVKFVDLVVYNTWFKGVDFVGKKYVGGMMYFVNIYGSYNEWLMGTNWLYFVSRICMRNNHCRKIERFLLREMF